MIKRWNDPLKELLTQAPQDFVKWLTPHSTFDEELSPYLADGEFETDLLCRVFYGYEPYLLHVQFQRESDLEAAQHLLMYNVMASNEYDLAVYSVLIYLKPEEFVAESPFIIPSPISGRGDTLRFYYQTVRLWEIPTETIVQAGIEGILPLVPFTSQGSQRQSIDQTIRTLSFITKRPRVEMLLLTYQLAELVYTTPEDINWLSERFAIIDTILDIVTAVKNSSVYKEWQKESEEYAIRQAMRQLIVAATRTHFPSLVELAQKRVELLETSDQLQEIVLHLAQAESEKEAKAAFAIKDNLK
ncbi:MAG: hypothetical protein H0U76_17890 [Ktedonobacteraceae bacterium]|nr:hypothetical protein [Ktedonobacteraceae bacterium]